MTATAAKGMTVFCYAQDFEKELAFYEKALGITAERHGPHWAAFVMGGSRFALHAMPDDPTDPKPFHLDFVSDDIDASLAQFVEAGGTEDKPAVVGLFTPWTGGDVLGGQLQLTF